ncbi:hypothetical protein Sjap_024836 [Stephania japonica]|uniref:Protein kinase domain-containing protein n=1 Tax=Stephania japonica TaxID=461633 RepID=A0AAP0EMS3_9MAGN
MGRGTTSTLVDDVVRWFQRRSSSSSSSIQDNHKSQNQIPSSSSLSGHPITLPALPSLTTTTTTTTTDQKRSDREESEEDGDGELQITVDFDLSGLKSIKVPNRHFSDLDSQKKSMPDTEFFTEYGETNRFRVLEVIGKGSYGVVASAVDTHTGEKVAIKKINDVFEHVSDATRILREIKLLRLLRHPDVVEIKHIMLPPSRREFRDIYVVFELMESDLHQVIKANDDLTHEHYQFFLYQLLRSLKYIHSANVFHRDLKPKNILANADCKLKICDFGLARVSFNDAPSAIFWTYTPAIDIWSIGCIFAEMVTGKPVFPGKNVVHQLDLMTDLLGTPPAETVARIRNEKARRYLSSMRKKPAVPFSQKFPKVDPLALRLLERLLAFDPKDRPSAAEALADPYFQGLANVDREPSTHAISKLEFEFERRKLAKDDVRQLIYREILEYHPQMLQEYLCGGEQTSFMYPSGVERFKRQFAHLEEHYGKGERSAPLQMRHASLPRERVCAPKDLAASQNEDLEMENADDDAHSTLQNPQNHNRLVSGASGNYRSLVKSESISASKCISVKGIRDSEWDGRNFSWPISSPNMLFLVASRRLAFKVFARFLSEVTQGCKWGKAGRRLKILSPHPQRSENLQIRAIYP